MNCVEFDFDRSRAFGSGRGQFWPIAIDRPTSPYNIASTSVQQVIVTSAITCKRGSAKHSVKDDHAFLWKHAIFSHLSSRNPSTDRDKISHD
jgi:hypothetical protein